MTRRFADARPCLGATYDDLNPALVEGYRQELDRRKPGSSLLRLPDEKLLEQVQALARVRGRLRPTLSGVLFFAHQPQRFYPSLTITFLHFPGTDTTSPQPGDPLYLDNREFGGPLPAAIDATRAAIFEKLSRGAVMDGFVRQDLLEYPEAAYREAVVNAVGHRDYDLDGSFIQVRLFADRLEVQSPGGLGGHLTVDNIAHEQYTRNPHLMRLLEDYGYVERRGLGVDQMVHAMDSAGLQAPAFEDKGTSFWVTLRREPISEPVADEVPAGLNARQVQALAYLRAKGRITNRQYQAEFGVSERTALYDLQGLVKAGLALPVSSGRGRHYIARD